LRSGEGCLWVDCGDVVLIKERKVVPRIIRRVGMKDDVSTPPRGTAMGEPNG